MKRIVIIYTSMSGNTEAMAWAIASGVRATGLEVEVKDSLEIMPNELLNYQGIMLGTYTWGDGEIPDEFLDFYEEMGELELTSKTGAVFGSCSSLYNHFGKAVDLLKEKLMHQGVKVTQDPLKIELTPNKEELEICKEFGKNFGLGLLKEEVS